MKLIKWIKDGWKRRQRRHWDFHYHDGVQWAYYEYYTGGYSLETIQDAILTSPVTHPAFAHGACDGLRQIERALAAKRDQINQKGEPIDTPFFVVCSSAR